MKYLRRGNNFPSIFYMSIYFFFTYIPTPTQLTQVSKESRTQDLKFGSS